MQQEPQKDPNRINRLAEIAKQAKKLVAVGQAVVAAVSAIITAFVAFIAAFWPVILATMAIIAVVVTITSIANTVLDGITDVFSLGGTGEAETTLTEKLIEDNPELKEVMQNEEMSATVAAALDCSNLPPSEAKPGENCIEGLLAAYEEKYGNGGKGPVPARAEWMVPVWQEAAKRFQGDWILLAAIEGARSNFGLKNCENYMDGSGVYRIMSSNWDMFAYDGGRSPKIAKSGGCYESYTLDQAIEDKQPESEEEKKDLKEQYKTTIVRQKPLKKLQNDVIYKYLKGKPGKQVIDRDRVAEQMDDFDVNSWDEEYDSGFSFDDNAFTYDDGSSSSSSGGGAGSQISLYGSSVADIYDPVDATFTQSRMLAHRGAFKKEDWEGYTGSGPGQCTTTPDDGPVTYLPSDVVASGMGLTQPGTGEIGPLGGVKGTGLTKAEVKAARGHVYGGNKATEGKYESTAYGPPWNSMQGYGTTATGVALKKAGGDAKKYLIAIDPSVNNYGKFVYVWPNPFKWTGPFVTADTGGAIVGNRIDFYDWRGREAQYGWGRREVTLSKTPIKGGAGSGGRASGSIAGATSTGGGTVKGMNKAQNSFVKIVSSQIGLDPGVVAAWVYYEGGPPDNPLNIGPHHTFGSVKAGAKATVDLLNQSLYKGIRASVGKSPREQFEALTNSSWCPGCAGYLEDLIAVYKTRVKGKVIYMQAPVQKGEGGIIPYTGKPQTDPVSDAVRSRTSAAGHSDCYVAVVNSWWKAIEKNPPQGAFDIGGPLRSRIVKIAQAELAKNVSETGSDNRPVYGTTGEEAPYSIVPEPWCQAFASMIWYWAGIQKPMLGIGGMTNHQGLTLPAYTGAVTAWGQEEGLYKSKNPLPGDLLFYSDTHVEIVEKVRGGTVLSSIGGNTSDAVTRVAMPSGYTHFVAPPGADSKTSYKLDGGNTKLKGNLSKQISQLEDNLNTEIGLAYSGPKGTVSGGSIGTAPAWSTFKVPIAIARLRAGASAAQKATMVKMIRASDNDATAAIWSSLGSKAQAEKKVTKVLRLAGDTTTVSKTRQGNSGAVSTFGQTQWSAAAANKVYLALSRGKLLKGAKKSWLLDQMRNIDQTSWGVSKAGFAASKPGWGPDPARGGKYDVRSSGVKGRYALTIIVVSGTQGEGESDLNRVAAWVKKNESKLQKKSSGATSSGTGNNPNKSGRPADDNTGGGDWD